MPVTPQEAKAVVHGLRGTLLRNDLRNVLFGRLAQAAKLWRRGGLSLTDLRDIRRRKPWMTVDELREPYRIAFVANESFLTAPTAASLGPQYPSALPVTDSNIDSPRPLRVTHD